MRRTISNTNDEVQEEKKEGTICESCGHHGFCKFEEDLPEKLKAFGEEVASLKVPEPLLVGLQCQGFCTAMKPEDLPK